MDGEEKEVVTFRCRLCGDSIVADEYSVEKKLTHLLQEHSSLVIALAESIFELVE
jgi:hypothetical protein